uniref:Tubulin--tyrosine ligase-like protein 5 n=1 Tax=Trepomonas sp. PC1 TaxID=1076344 RepID=A0A146K6P2_9EUKA|eukprot:JAP92287.1 Tubulin tyrosine ligase [Trepomonas sp. PC1]
MIIFVCIFIKTLVHFYKNCIDQHTPMIHLVQNVVMELCCSQSQYQRYSLVNFKGEKYQKCSNVSKTYHKTGPIAKIVTSTLKQAGFVQKNDTDADLLYYTSAKIELFKQMKPYQKVQQVPYHREFVKKQRLAVNLQGNRYVPKSWVFPSQMQEFAKDYVEGRYYILKNSQHSTENSPKLVRNLQDINLADKQVIQEYLDPLLINGYKFHLRVYIVITNVKPMIVYYYPEGLVWFATEKYEQPDESNYQNSQMHFSNFAKNGHHVSDLGDGIESRMRLSWLRRYLKMHHNRDLNQELHKLFQSVFAQLRTAIYKHKADFEQNYFGLYGADVMVTEDLQFKLLDIILQPSLGTQTQVDKDVKSQLVVDYLHLGGIKCEKQRQSTLNEKLRIQLQIDEENARKGDFVRVLPTRSELEKEL